MVYYEFGRVKQLLDSLRLSTEEESYSSEIGKIIAFIIIRKSVFHLLANSRTYFLTYIFLHLIGGGAKNNDAFYTEPGLRNLRQNCVSIALIARDLRSQLSKHKYQHPVGLISQFIDHMKHSFEKIEGANTSFSSLLDVIIM